MGDGKKVTFKDDLGQEWEFKFVAGTATVIDAKLTPAKVKVLADHFFLLVIFDAKKEGFRFFNRDGELVGKHETLKNIIPDLKEVTPDPKFFFTFVKSYVCGFFKQGAELKSLKFHAKLELGTMPTCEAAPEVETGSPADPVLAKKQALKLLGEWDVDLDVTRPGGVPFASIGCGVFASVSLVLLVLLAKKRSHVEVPLVDDE